MFVLVGILGTFLVLLYLGWARGGPHRGRLRRRHRRAARHAGWPAASRASRSRCSARASSACFVPLIVGVLLFVTVIGIPLGVLVLHDPRASRRSWASSAWASGWATCCSAAAGPRATAGPSDRRSWASSCCSSLSIIPLVSFFVGWFALGHRDPQLRGGRSSDVAGRRRRAPASPPGPACRRRGRHRPRTAGWPQQQPPQVPQGWGQPPTTGPPTGWNTVTGTRPQLGPATPPAGHRRPAGWGQPPARTLSGSLLARPPARMATPAHEPDRPAEVGSGTGARRTASRGRPAGPRTRATRPDGRYDG